MKWLQHKSLSEADMELLVGSTTMEHLQRNRLVIIFGDNGKIPAYKDMGLNDCEGLYFVRQLDDTTIEILFELEGDIKIVDQTLTQLKMSVD